MRVKRGREWSENFPARDPFRFPPADGVADFREARRRVMARQRKQRQREREKLAVLQAAPDRMAA